MNTLRTGLTSEAHVDFTTGQLCNVGATCDAQGARSGNPCQERAVQWQDMQSADMLLHAHVCAEHRTLRTTPNEYREARAARTDRFANDSHSWLYRTVVHPLVAVGLLGLALVTKAAGVW